MFSFFKSIQQYKMNYITKLRRFIRMINMSFNNNIEFKQYKLRYKRKQMSLIVNKQSETLILRSKNSLQYVVIYDITLQIGSRKSFCKIKFIHHQIFFIYYKYLPFVYKL